MKKIFMILPLALILCFMVDCHQEVKTKEMITKTEIENSIIIPGTWSLDVDSLRFIGDSYRYRARLGRSNLKIDVDYKSLKFGARQEKCDLFWRHVNQISRSLDPLFGAKFAYLGKVKFEDLTLNHLQKEQYSKERIMGDDSYNQLVPSTVIGIKTNNGNYAKMRIDGYLPRIINQELRENYHLRCTIVLYLESNKYESEGLTLRNENLGFRHHAIVNNSSSKYCLSTPED